jgi:hypothetical protein
VIDRNFELAKHKYSARSYIKVLEAEIEPVSEVLDTGYLFMQDNTSIHRAHTVRAWFNTRGIIYITDWPAVTNAHVT